MKKLFTITRESGIPLVGCIAYGIIDRGTSTIQVRPTSACNMNCNFCSTDGGYDSKYHPVDYEVELSYLLDWVKQVVKEKGKVDVFIDSVGDPMMYREIVELIRELKKMKEIGKIAMVTNGTLFGEDRIEKLEKAGLDQINISIHAIDKELGKKLMGRTSYDLDKVLDSCRKITKTKIKLVITPVLIPNLNDDEIPRIIEFCKEIGAVMGLQKFEIYKHSRKPKGAKDITYWKFYKRLQEWEKQFNIKLIDKGKELKELVEIRRTNRLKCMLNKGDKIYAEIKAPGWMYGQKIAAAGNRSISINRCDKNIGDKVKVTIEEVKDNIILGSV
ncbi:MAG: radical SAM protein [Candidatus Woesearchaeota archaeon]|nr:MAG: radical SAM protein [Candidatus Woesearchaeota archaeon]